MPEDGVVRSAVVGDDPLARGGLSLLLGGDPRIEVVSELAATADLAEALDAADPDITVWDLGPDPRSSFDRVTRVVASDHALLVLVPGEDAAAELIALGALGVLLRDSGKQRLRAAALAVAAGLVALDEPLAKALIGTRAPALSFPVETLTQRELEVLELVAEGLSNKLIAARLGISDHTAKFHVNAILAKLGVQTRTEAVVRGARLGLLSL